MTFNFKIYSTRYYGSTVGQIMTLRCAAEQSGLARIARGRSEAPYR